MATINYADKVAINVNPNIPEINKVTDGNMNLIKQVGNQILTTMGVYTDDWNSSSTYAIGDIVIYDNRIFRNLTGTNTETTPDIDTTNWEETTLASMSGGGGGGITGDTLPIGAIVPFGGWDAPTGWLICDGTLLNKTDYPELFNAIGYSFGGEEGGSTFGLPDLRGRVPVGEKDNDSDFDGIGVTGGSKYLQAHRHEGVVSNYGGTLSSFTGTGTDVVYDLGSLYQENKQENSTMITGITGAGNSGNLQPYQVVCYIIKANQSAGLVANVSNAYSTSQSDTYSCDYINSLGKTITFNNEWRLATKPAGSSYLMISIPVLNPSKTAPTFSTGFTAEVYVNGWESCTYSVGYTSETNIGIRIIYPSGTQITDGLNYLVRFKGTITINN